MDMRALMETEYEHLPIEVRQQVLGAAAYYLDMVARTGTLPGIEDTVVMNMDVWCYYSQGCTVEACLAGIWYMGITGTMLDLSLLSTSKANILIYLDMVAITRDTDKLHELVGCSSTYQGAGIATARRKNGEDVQRHLHSLMEVTPIMKKAYEACSGWFL